MTSGRLVRAALVTTLLLLAPGRAGAAGTGGIEVSPYPGLVNGKQVTAFHTKVPSSGAATVRYSLRNTTTGTRSARLYAASATRDGTGWAIGDPGSSPYITFPERTVTLKAGEVRLETFTVHGKVDSTRHGAIVVQVSTGSITQRAATLVYLEKGRTVPLPLLVVLVAGALVALAGAGFLLVRRRARSTTASGPSDG
jgi:hypothetical protein